MRSLDLINICRDIAINYKTLYVYGCFGAPLNDANKQRYTHNYPYNEQPSRAKKILAASPDTFGFDCVNLIKGILWGWNGNVNAVYGGAVYASNGVPDTNANGMFLDCCYDQSNDFSNIIPGEFVWMEGHIGVYIGDGYVVECTPIWKDGVQITYLGNWGGNREGYSTRTWTSHGKCKFIDYSGSPEPTPEPTPISLKYKVGDKMIFTGRLYATAYGEDPGQERENLVCTITSVCDKAGVTKPYNIDDGLGWVSEEDLTPYKEEPISKEIELGDTVIVNGVGTAASTGEGARTRYFKNQEMKVIMIAGNTSRPNRYALNQYNKGVVGDPRSVTAWFSEKDIRLK